MKKRHSGTHLRSGFTTGACAAAASKAALLQLLMPEAMERSVSIPFPDGSRHEFELLAVSSNSSSSSASVLKDAGDDPDVTNGAEVGARVKIIPLDGENTEKAAPPVCFKAGPGVGTVTKKGLSVPRGEPAINPGPRRMIKAALMEALSEAGVSIPEGKGIEVSIFIKDGQRLAQNTLNPRLGVRGGLSVLGTTGIVRPISAKAWTDTIDVCLNVARTAGLAEVILSTGRTSEKAVQTLLGLPDEALVMMGDYLEYAMKAAGKQGFQRIHMAGMWAKIIKAALEIPQTHVRHGALDMNMAEELLSGLGLPSSMKEEVRSANTAKQILDMLLASGQKELIKAVCLKARQYAERVSGTSVSLYLVNADKDVIVSV